MTSWESSNFVGNWSGIDNAQYDPSQWFVTDEPQRPVEMNVGQTRWSWSDHTQTYDFGNHMFVEVTRSRLQMGVGGLLQVKLGVNSPSASILSSIEDHRLAGEVVGVTPTGSIITYKGVNVEKSSAEGEEITWLLKYDRRIVQVRDMTYIDIDLSSPVSFQEKEDKRKVEREINLFGQPLGVFQATLGQEFMGLPVEDQDTILGMLSTLSPKGRDLADRLVFLLVEEEKKEANPPLDSELVANVIFEYDADLEGIVARGTP